MKSRKPKSGSSPQDISPPVEARAKRGRPKRFALSRAAEAEIKNVASQAGLSPEELLSQMLESFSVQVLKHAPMTLFMTGSAETLEQKRLCLAAFGEGKGETLAARAAGVTKRTVRHWLNTDPTFYELAEDAVSGCVEEIEHLLYVDGRKPGPQYFSSKIAILNAKNPDYGVIRPQMLMRILAPCAEKIIDCGAKFIPEPDDIETFGTKVGEIIDSVMVNLSSPRKK